MVGMLGIEPSLHAPEACVLPVYYIPISCLLFRTKITLIRVQLLAVWSKPVRAQTASESRYQSG